MTKTQKVPNMFKRLKLHFVLNAALLSGVVIAIAFSVVYSVVSRSYQDFRPPKEFTEPVQELFETRIRADRANSLETLLFTLIITGIAMEIIVIIASLWAAEGSIRPVRNAYEAQKTFVSNASHEIKTPLAVIQANLEAADIQDNHWIDNAMQKVEEAVELNNSLLTLARMDQVVVTPAKKSNVILPNLVKKTADFYRPKIEEKGIILKIDAERASGEKISVARAELTQLLNILLDNAVKYAKSSIKITLNKSKITITNDGATIPAEKLPHIFERFYQTDKSKPGVGLGLSIAKSLADRNHWQLTVDSDEKTTTFTLSLH